MTIIKHGTVTVSDGGHVAVEGFHFEGGTFHDGAIEAMEWAIATLRSTLGEFRPAETDLERIDWLRGADSTSGETA